MMDWLPIDHMMELTADIMDRLGIHDNDDDHTTHCTILDYMVKILNVDTSEGLD